MPYERLTRPITCKGCRPKGWHGRYNSDETEVKAHVCVHHYDVTLTEVREHEPVDGQRRWNKAAWVQRPLNLRWHRPEHAVLYRISNGLQNGREVIELRKRLGRWGIFRQQGNCDKCRGSNVGERTKHRRHTNTRTNWYQ